MSSPPIRAAFEHCLWCIDHVNGGKADEKDWTFKRMRPCGLKNLTVQLLRYPSAHDPSGAAAKSGFPEKPNQGTPPQNAGTSPKQPATRCCYTASRNRVIDR